MKYELTADSFSLALNTIVFESDIEYPNNTILEVTVESGGFRACTTMDIDIKEFRVFISEINRLYETLQGDTMIKEPYGSQKIQFSADKKGHILVSGFLHNNFRNGNHQSLEFENSFDQTFLKAFVMALNDMNS
ncbi:MAG: hypothetical protein IJ642_13560 [Oscillospiraceae bacterium]|nr:hypothetical protein [Oscillospiraceae bacterium]